MKRLIAVVTVLGAVAAYAAPPKIEGLAEIDKMIRAGEIKVGKDYSMGFQGRFHQIHQQVLQMGCNSCHVPTGYAPDYLLVRKFESSTGAPGPVDRSTCLGCHKQGGLATPWYQTQAR